MKTLVALLSATLLLATQLFSQEKADSTVWQVTCNPYNPEDTLGQVIWTLLNDYETYGHFAQPGSGTRKDFAERFESLFAPNSMLPNDLEGYEQLVQKLSIQEYAKMGLTKGYRPYLLVAQKKEFSASQQELGDDFIGYIKLFKVFSDTARQDKEYERGVMYELEIRLNLDSNSAVISNITLIENKIYDTFLFSGYGYQGNSRVLLTNNLNKIVSYKEPPKPKVLKWTKSGFFLHGGYLFTNYLGSEAFGNNISNVSTFTGDEYGYVAGLQYQKVYGENGIFGILFGVEYELNYYNLEHTNLGFQYTTDCNGNPLVDLLGSPYDRKDVDVSSYSESGEFAFIRPEIGLFVNLGLGRSANLQLFGAVGNAFVSQASYDAKATISYTGYSNGGQITDDDLLGFYKDREFEYSGSPENLQGFMFYRAGATLDFRLANWLAFSLLAEYRGSMTYAMRFKQFNCAFLDPEDARTFISRFDHLSTSRYYNAIGVQAGFKIMIKEKRRQE